MMRALTKREGHGLDTDMHDEKKLIEEILVQEEPNKEQEKARKLELNILKDLKLGLEMQRMNKR